jgi:hypothetical protein
MLQAENRIAKMGVSLLFKDRMINHKPVLSELLH